MNAIQFIQDNGVEKAREVVEGAPGFLVFGYCNLTGSYIFKRKDATAYYHNETNSWSEEYALELIQLKDLECLVKSVDLIGKYHSIDHAKNHYNNMREALNQYQYENKDIDDLSNELKQAIADVESCMEVAQ